MWDALIFCPKELSIGAIVVSFLTSIGELKKGHIGRIGLISNVFFLWQIFFPKWNTLHPAIQAYLDFGTIMAAIAFITYCSQMHLKTVYYKIGVVLYGSISIVVVVYFVFLTNLV